jgi:hypothetical protein
VVRPARAGTERADADLHVIRNERDGRGRARRRRRRTVGHLSVISDMDGVIYRGRHLIPGAQQFIDRMREREVNFLFLTNNSEQTPLDLVRKLAGLGISGLTEGNFITSAMATAQFLATQIPGGSPMSSGAADCPLSSTRSAIRSRRPAPTTSWSARPPISRFR